jgi:hypothetical protein
MFGKICMTCLHHVWSDEQYDHVCAKDGSVKGIEDTCGEGHREDLRGKYEVKEFGKDKTTEEEYHEMIDMTNEEVGFTWEEEKTS